jgi:hypothetical protein
MMFLLTETSRAHSSGSENTSHRTFSTVEDLANFVYFVWYEQFCEAYDFPEMWDAEDMGMEFPSIQDFRPKTICEKISQMKHGNTRPVKLFDAYSKYASLVPNELIVSVTTDS